MINIQEVSQSVKETLGTFLSNELHTDTRLIGYINAAIRKIILSYNFPDFKYIYTLTTNGIDTSYNIPYNIQTYYVKDSSGADIDDIKDFETYYYGSEQTGICIKGDKLYTTEVGTYTIYYRGCPESITSLIGVVDMPLLFQDPLTYYAIKVGFRLGKKYDEMAIWDKEFQIEMNRLSASLTNQLPNNIVNFGQEHVI